MKTSSRRLIRFLIPLMAPAVAFTQISCNLFDPIDNPGGDAQLISAARACFDHGDFECASAKYQEVSDSNTDIRESESAFVLLGKNGASLGTFVTAFGTTGNLSGGSALTKLANQVAIGSGETRRLEIFNAYKKVASIQNQDLRGLVRFVSAIALAAEILGEASVTLGDLRASDLVTTPSSCNNSSMTILTCLVAGAVPCSISSSGKLPTATSDGTTAISLDLDTATTADLSGAVTLNMLNAALREVLYALTTELSASGGIGSSTLEFLNDALRSSLGKVGSVDSPCFRWALVSEGVGAS